MTEEANRITMPTIQYGCIRKGSANAKTGEVQKKIKGLAERVMMMKLIN